MYAFAAETYVICGELALSSACGSCVCQVSD